MERGTDVKGKTVGEEQTVEHIRCNFAEKYRSVFVVQLDQQEDTLATCVRIGYADVLTETVRVNNFNV